MGLTSGHWSKVYRCGQPLQRGQVCNSSNVIEDPLLGRQMVRLRNELLRLEKSNYDKFDFCQFGFLDAVADVPVPELFPFIYGAHGPETKVILTLRNASDWARRR